jgi:hypothetical protein
LCERLLSLVIQPKLNSEGREVQMIIIKFAALTCAIYLAIAVILEVVFFVLSITRGGLMVGGGIRGWAVLFGLVWLVSFTSAFYIIHASIRAKLAH